MSTFNYEAYKALENDLKKISDTLVIEAPLQININSEAYTVVMRTPGNDYELIRGLLFAEDIYKKPQNFDYEILEASTNGFSIINVSIPKNNLGNGYLNKRTLLSVSSCGICGKQKIDDIKVTGNKMRDEITIKPSQLQRLFFEMKQKQVLFKKTGGSHAAAIFNKEHQLLTVKEDIGRHNAVDKSIGNLLTNNKIKAASILIVSGRVSYEIISKAFIANIPVVASVSASSSLAIDFAKEFGMKLISFCRDKKATYYT
ncbi:formate dehydrogenase accessory sulfurtransferase FdhD [Aureibaculum marinum]|uniref:Sulfur carrier protein FdhD n=1 Tax=Aureibaculum marinum TaxID=2487930 RepID=A0A3N4N9P5_9FLAO|nr:formate dehydrogenase accessory sulfurtransferase FdhD [Aureibaculum marinum]RPD93064.1 formate dehydrogenase accessory sulfurtransferase FdhD [Aureibaculum marinum]